MNKFDKAVELYIAMNKAYAELPDGKYESKATKVATKAYHEALTDGDLMDSQIVDHCWDMEF
jgi:hypothetical protein